MLTSISNNDLVVTPFEGSPKIKSLGWEETYLYSSGSVWEIPSYSFIFVCSFCLSSWFSCGAISYLSFDDSSCNSPSASSLTTPFSTEEWLDSSNVTCMDSSTAKVLLL